MSHFFSAVYCIKEILEYFKELHLTFPNSTKFNHFQNVHEPSLYKKKGSSVLKSTIYQEKTKFYEEKKRLW